MKSQDILTGMIQSLGSPVGSYSKKDVDTVISRMSHEGESFLEISLPRIDDALLQGLATGLLPRIEGWKTKSGWSHPEFLHGFWKRIFTVKGELLPSACVHSIRAIRQISRAYKKVFEVCSEDRIEQAVARFKEVDRELSQVKVPPYMDALSEIAHYLYGEVVGTSISGELVFRHGPGAVAERHDSLFRWSFETISSRVESLVGAETFRPTWESLMNDPPRVDEIPARLVAVPKTAVKPRLISIEPSYNQFIQQGLMVQLYDRLSRYPVINIRDQSRNKDLARKGSIDGSLATIDLSDASDRVHYGLLKAMFSWNPTFVEFLDATRSRLIQTPSEVLILNKYASMGSALTFPVETMFFLAIVVYTMCESVGDFSRRAVRSYLTDGRIGVYGDDIIVPVSVVPTLIRHLEEVGLRVNTDKSFSTGGFRESCGGDYWRGYNITPVYVRRRMPQSTRDVAELVSLSSFRNLWVAKYGYSELTSSIDSFITGLIPYPAARQENHLLHSSAPDGVRGICRYGPEDIPNGTWNRDLFRREVKMMVPVALRKETVWSDTAALYKSLYEGYNQDVHHLTHHGRPISAKLRYRSVGIG
jgi:hypothetical protein